MDKFDKILDLLGVLSRAFPNVEVKTETLLMYAEDLESVDLEVLDKVFKRIRRENKFFPVLSEIWKAVNEATSKKAGGMPEPVILDEATGKSYSETEFRKLFPDEKELSFDEAKDLFFEKLTEKGINVDRPANVLNFIGAKMPDNPNPRGHVNRKKENDEQ